MYGENIYTSISSTEPPLAKSKAIILNPVNKANPLRMS